MKSKFDDTTHEIFIQYMDFFSQMRKSILHAIILEEAELEF